MGDLLIRNIEPEIEARLEARAKSNGRSRSEEALHIMSEGLADKRTGVEEEVPGDFVKSLIGLFADIPDEEKEEFAKIMDEIEAERKTDFGRPFSFEE